MSNITKTAEQKSIAAKWRDSMGRGGADCPTGFGKTYLTLEFIVKPMLEKRPFDVVIVVVHTTALKNQWIAKVPEHLPSEVRNQVRVVTVQDVVMKKLILTCNLLVLDEVDEYYADERKKVWDGTYVRFKWLFWLSATPKDRRQRDDKFLSLYPCIREISIEEAIEKEWISPFKEFNIGIDLTDEEKQEYEQVDALLSKEFPKFGFDLGLVHKCIQKETKDTNGKAWTNRQWAMSVSAKQGWLPDHDIWMSQGFPPHVSHESRETIKAIWNMWEPGKVIGYAKKILEYLHRRTMIIYNAKNKKQLTVEICKKFPNRKTIIFSQSTSFCDDVSTWLNQNHINCLVYHSNLESRPLRLNYHGEPDILGQGEYVKYKTGAKKGELKMFGEKVIRESILYNITEGHTNHLACGTALDKGLDIPDLELAIMTSMSRNSNQYTQRRGRITRVTEGGSLFMYIVCIYARGTKDEQYLKDAQAGSRYVYEIDEIDQICDNPVIVNKNTFSLDDL